MLYCKALHLIFMITWFAGLFYLPRLFIYHALAEDKISLERFKLMEHRLFWWITTPSMLACIITGSIMLYAYAWAKNSQATWLHIKLSLGLSLVVFHYYCWKFMQAFKADQNKKSDKYFRFFNEYPSLVLVITIFLIVLKPF